MDQAIYSVSWQTASAKNGVHFSGTFLTHLAVNGHVSASTQIQALSVALFLYKEVLAWCG
ncbi:hypothetical protein V3O24_08055 [Methylobacter sp. Wu8]|uniref:phage integrase N-terminal SAM-like domain-containing protein n=1 Tax=Methylobacter sp. Wu8 TaxID=3118457 RepID=UPI002F319D7C|nr:hypothetical protein [Methylobacter tundripaludum]